MCDDDWQCSILLRRRWCLLPMYEGHRMHPSLRGSGGVRPLQQLPRDGWVVVRRIRLLQQSLTPADNGRLRQEKQREKSKVAPRSRPWQEAHQDGSPTL